MTERSSVAAQAGGDLVEREPADLVEDDRLALRGRARREAVCEPWRVGPVETHDDERDVVIGWGPDQPVEQLVDERLGRRVDARRDHVRQAREPVLEPERVAERVEDCVYG